jgi:malic enzyme
MMAGLHVSKLKLEDMRMVVFGSGTAGTGIADQVRDAIAADSGKTKEEAAKQIWYVRRSSNYRITNSPGASTNPASSSNLKATN